MNWPCCIQPTLLPKKTVAIWVGSARQKTCLCLNSARRCCNYNQANILNPCKPNLVGTSFIWPILAPPAQKKKPNWPPKIPLIKFAWPFLVQKKRRKWPPIKFARACVLNKWPKPAALTLKPKQAVACCRPSAPAI